MSGSKSQITRRQPSDLKPGSPTSQGIRWTISRQTGLVPTMTGKHYICTQFNDIKQRSSSESLKSAHILKHFVYDVINVGTSVASQRVLVTRRDILSMGWDTQPVRCHWWRGDFNQKMPHIPLSHAIITYNIYNVLMDRQLLKSIDIVFFCVVFCTFFLFCTMCYTILYPYPWWNSSYI